MLFLEAWGVLKKCKKYSFQIINLGVYGMAKLLKCPMSIYGFWTYTSYEHKTRPLLMWKIYLAFSLKIKIKFPVFFAFFAGLFHWDQFLTIKIFQNFCQKAQNNFTWLVPRFLNAMLRTKCPYLMWLSCWSQIGEQNNLLMPWGIP